MNISDVICLDDRYSTTRLVSNKRPSMESKYNQKLEFTLFSPKTINRKGEGGLRVKNYYKRNNYFNKDDFSTNDKPLITVITVVYNGEKLLEQTIQSVINQSYDNIEYIIIDGGSTDGTLDIIRKYEHAIDYWLSEPDSGIYDAWNKGILLSTGEWIAFLGSDDVYLDNAIQIYVDNISDNSDEQYDYMSSKVNLISDSKVIRVIGKKWKWDKFRKYMTVAHVGSLHHRSIYERYGLYDTSYKICGDYELLLRLGPSMKPFYVDRITVNMNIEGISNNNPLSFDETYRAKVESRGRSSYMSYFDKIIALIKWKVRASLR